jgi:hypothetical protein
MRHSENVLKPWSLSSIGYIVAIFGWCIWRGGTYYIEVFSEKYKLKFIKVRLN